MPTKVPPHSTRLENLRLADGRALLEIDGKAVELAGDQVAPSIQAFQAFYSEAQRAYTAEPAQPNRVAGTPAPWWQRLRSWLARWLGPADGAPSAGASAPAPPVLAAPTAAAAKSDAEAPAPAAAAQLAPAAPAKRGPKAAPAPALAPAPTPAAAPPGDPKTSTASVPVDPVKRSSRAASSPAPRNDASAPPETHPLLRAAFADEKGVHLIWDLPAAKGPARQTELLYPLNSPVADRLQACYSQLAEMGYDVVDLEVWRKTPEAENSPAIAPTTPSAAPAQAKSGPSSRSVSAAAPKAELPFIAELRPRNADNPGRLVVSALEGDKKSHPILVAEPLANALHHAADPGHPAAERLTFLRCAKIGENHRIMQVGFGQAADGRPEPANWKPVEDWWESVRKAPEAAAPPQLSPQTRGAEPELF